MTLVLPRLANAEEEAAVARAVADSEPASIASWMPHPAEHPTWPATGSTRVAHSQLLELRTELLSVARGLGYPDGPASRAFDAPAGKVLRRLLPVTAHEASHRAAWAYLSCCYLLDISVWRWGGTSGNHFTGNPNRDTFRRLWWRGHVFGDDFDLSRLQEDELVGLTERPHLPPVLVRVVADEFLGLVESRRDLRRMVLMRETAKRLLRRTPLVDFMSLRDAELRHEARRALSDALVSFDLAPMAPLNSSPVETLAAPAVSSLRRTVRVDQLRADSADSASILSEDERRALTIARRAGRVTSADLRHSVGDTAPQLLTGLVAKGLLEKRGQTRGTHYVMGPNSQQRGQPSAVSAESNSPSERRSGPAITESTSTDLGR